MAMPRSIVEPRRQLSSVQDRVSHVTAFNYQVTANADGTYTPLLSAITNAYNNIFTNHYDMLGRVDYQIDQAGNRTDYGWSTPSVGKVTYPTVMSVGSRTTYAFVAAAMAARSARGSLGRPRTRSPMMFFWISDEPE